MKQLNSNKIVHITNNRYRPHYHIATNGGWLNDPNGLCYFKGYYHVFYQYHPYSTQWGPMHWGHVRSKDLIHWEQLPVALVPGDSEDEGGCFSGSAIVKDDKLYLIYTGQHYYNNNDLDHFWENQNIAYSEDGVHFTKYKDNPIISAPDDNSQDFRDPKVWKHNGKYYLILGSRDKKTNHGRILLYSSDNLFNWNLKGTIAKSHDINREGSMWECPDLFSLDDHDVLICSPEGIKATDKEYLNVSQVCYSIGQLDYQTNKFTGSNFNELDHGHNFYATQSFESPDNRRIQIGWMSPFDENQAEHTDGWAGLLTLPRELHIKNQHLYAEPIKELTSLRKKKDIDNTLTINDEQNLTVSDPQHTEFIFNFDDAPHDFNWQLKDDKGILINLHYQNHELVLTRRGEDGKRYAKLPQQLHQLQIYIDTSSVEIFINHGWTSFTDRYYAKGTVSYSVTSKQPCQTEITAYALR